MFFLLLFPSHHSARLGFGEVSSGTWSFLSRVIGKPTRTNINVYILISS